MEAARWFPHSVRAAALTLLIAAPALADDEATMRKAFEGKRVLLKVDMPATSTGIDVWPARDQPVAFPKVASLIKNHGTGIRAGESQMVTKIRLLKDHIEFQLGGGGYGTFGDLVTGPDRVENTYRGETQEERELKGQIKAGTGDKKANQRRLRDLERERQSDNSNSTAQAAQANRAADAEERARRLSAGSRFNIRWKEAVPPEFATVDGIRRALAEYVDFAPMSGVITTGVAVTGGAMALKKGLTIEEVEKLLGPASAISTDKASGLDVMMRSYEGADQRVMAKFVAGVLVDFVVTAK